MRRFLADANFPGSAVALLRAAGCDVTWVQEFMPSASDVMVLENAQAEGRVILTFDKDFSELAFRAGLPSSCGIVLFRLPMSPPAEAVQRAVSVILDRPRWTGRFSVVEPDRIREREF